MTDADTSGHADDHDETSVPGLWETARWFLRWLIAVCGTPCGIAGLGVLAPKERRDILRWLRPVEAIVRRLLVVEAARMAAELPPGKPGQKRPPRPPQCPVALLDPEDSAQWTVRFSLGGRAGKCLAGRRRARRTRWERPAAPGRCDNEFERMRRMLERLEVKPCPTPHRTIVRPANAAPTGPVRPWPSSALYSPWPPAVRIEAVARVLMDPAPHVKRLARRLARRRRADIERIARACRPPPERGKYRRLKLGEISIRHAGEHALEALEAFDTS